MQERSPSLPCLLLLPEEEEPRGAQTQARSAERLLQIRGRGLVGVHVRQRIHVYIHVYMYSIYTMYIVGVCVYVQIKGLVRN